MFEEHNSVAGWMGHGLGLSSTFVNSNGLTMKEYAFLRLPTELLFASELFVGSYLRRRKSVTEYEVKTTCTDRRLWFTGERLDQFDLDVFLACALCTSEQPSSKPRLIKIELKELARTILRSNTKTSITRVTESLQRLENCCIRVCDGQFVCHIRPVQKLLFDTGSGACLVELSPEILSSLQSTHNFHGFIRDRFKLRMSSMDRWLHGLLRYTSEICILFGQLPELSGNAYVQHSQVEQSLGRLNGIMRPGAVNVCDGMGLEIQCSQQSAGI